MIGHMFVQRLAATTLVGALALGFGGVGTALAANSTGNQADLQVSVQLGTVDAARTFTDTLVVGNAGNGAARNVTLRVPFDSAALKLLSVQGHTPDTWVSNLTSNQFEVNVDRVGSHDQSQTLQVTFELLPGYTLANSLTSHILYGDRDDIGSHSGAVDVVLLQNMAPGAPQAPVTAAVVPTDGSVSVAATSFVPNEQVTFWYTNPSGATLPLYVHDNQLVTDRRHLVDAASGEGSYKNNGTALAADASGSLSTTFMANGLAAGAYSIVAHGLTSGQQTVIMFSIQ